MTIEDHIKTAGRLMQDIALGSQKSTKINP